jgi:hypothetical protein
LYDSQAFDEPERSVLCAIVEDSLLYPRSNSKGVPAKRRESGIAVVSLELRDRRLADAHALRDFTLGQSVLLPQGDEALKQVGVPLNQGVGARVDAFDRLIHELNLIFHRLG